MMKSVNCSLPLRWCAKPLARISYGRGLPNLREPRCPTPLAPGLAHLHGLPPFDRKGAREEGRRGRKPGTKHNSVGRPKQMSL